MGILLIVEMEVREVGRALVRKEMFNIKGHYF